MIINCACGYPLGHTAGNTHDHATCLTCGWAAAGEGAEHAGTHHYWETHHRWTLSPYRGEQ